MSRVTEDSEVSSPLLLEGFGSVYFLCQISSCSHASGTGPVRQRCFTAPLLHFHQKTFDVCHKHGEHGLVLWDMS